jgi:hypothetical protein
MTQTNRYYAIKNRPKYRNPEGYINPVPVELARSEATRLKSKYGYSPEQSNLMAGRNANIILSEDYSGLNPGC